MKISKEELKVFKKLHEIFQIKAQQTAADSKKLLSQLEYYKIAIKEMKGPSEIQLYKTFNIIAELKTLLTKVQNELDRINLIFINHPVYTKAAGCSVTSEDKWQWVTYEHLNQYINLLEKWLNALSSSQLDQIMSKLQGFYNKDHNYLIVLTPILNSLSLVPNSKLTKQIQEIAPGATPRSFLDNIIGNFAKFYPNIRLCLTTEKTLDSAVLQGKIAYLLTQATILAEKNNHQSTIKPITHSSPIEAKSFLEKLNLTGNKYEDVKKLLNAIDKITADNPNNQILIRNIEIQLKSEKYEYLKECGILGFLTTYRLQDDPEIKTSASWASIQVAIQKKKNELEIHLNPQKSTIHQLIQSWNLKNNKKTDVAIILRGITSTDPNLLVSLHKELLSSKYNYLRECNVLRFFTSHRLHDNPNEKTSASWANIEQDILARIRETPGKKLPRAFPHLKNMSEVYSLRTT